MPNKNSFVKFIHMTASVRETRPCHIQITPQHDQFKTRITPKLATAIRSPNLQAQRILRSKSYSCVAERNRTVMVVITLKTILDGKVGYHICQETTARRKWERTGNVLTFDRNKLAQMYVSALYQFSVGLENKPAKFSPWSRILSCLV